MSQTELFAVVGAVLFAFALYGLITRPHLLHKILALNIMSSSIFLIFVATARRVYGPDPDPVPHAMVLTGIVVAVSMTSYALALAKRIYTVTGTAVLDPGDLVERGAATPEATDA